MRFNSLLLLILGLVVGLLFSSSSLSVRPDLRVLSFREFEPHLLKSNDTVYVINFWASWCVPCLEEIPAFQKLHEKYKDRKFKLLMVSLDFPSQIDKRLVPVISRYGLTADVIVLDDPDFNSWINKVSQDWSGSIPATLIYSSGWRKFYERSFTFEELEEIMELKLDN